MFIEEGVLGVVADCLSWCYNSLLTEGAVGTGGGHHFESLGCPLKVEAALMLT
jgi:hypothetical protein